MLKKTKVFVTICLLFSFTQILPNKAFASESVSQNQSAVHNDYSNVKNYAQNFFSQQNGKGVLNDPIKLYNLSGSVQALFFSSNENGYIIVNLSDYSVPEFSTVDNNKFITNDKKKHLYNGPLCYLEEDDKNQVTDSKTKENLGDLKNLKSLDIFPKMRIKKMLNSNSSAAVSDISNSELVSASRYPVKTTYYNIKNSLPSCTIDSRSSCSPTATLMLLKYYDNEYGNFIPSNMKNYGDGNLEVFIGNYMHSDEGGNEGTQDDNLVTGLQSYLNSQNLSRYTTKISSSEHSIIQYDGSHKYTCLDPELAQDLINSDNPFILNLTSNSTNSSKTRTYGQHSVTARGYSTLQVSYGTPYYSYTLVNDCWGDSSAWIDPAYARSMVYVKVN